METTKADESDDYLNDDKNSDYDEDYDESDRSSSPSSSATDAPLVSSKHKLQGEPGKSVVLKCDGEGFDGLTIFMWYNGTQLVFQGETMVSKDKRIEFHKKDGSLAIKDLNSYDDSIYRCRAYGKTHYETIVELQVNGAPRGISIFEHNQKTVDIAGSTFNYRAGKKDLKFTCDVEVSRPNAKFDWVHNGNTILEMQRKDHDLKIENDNILIIKNVHARHAGEYQCEASNDLGTVKATFKIDVECKLNSVGNIVNSGIFFGMN